jgi:iron complex outermembrane recepter protein
MRPSNWACLLVVTLSTATAVAQNSAHLHLAEGPQGDQTVAAPIQLGTATPQGDSKSSDAQKSIPEILVRGGRTMNVDVVRTEDDVQPYTIFDSRTIEQSGARDLEDFLKERLTMNTAFQSNTQVSGNLLGAASGINLRGLGTNETLILLDGRRMAGVNTLVGGAQPDINGIPLAAIERIEVLPSSASAIYGGAAVGGVVNIILKKTFQGGELSGTYDGTFRAHAPVRDVNATYGFSLFEGKTQVMLTGAYSDGDALTTRDRLNLVGRGLGAIMRNSPSLLYSSTNPFFGSTPNISSADADADGNQTNLTLTNGTPLNAPTTFVPKGAAPGSDISAALLHSAGAYNLSLSPGVRLYGLQQPFGAVPTNKSFMVTARQQVTPTVEVFTEFINKSNSTSEPNNSLYSLSVPAGAPINPFQQDVTVNAPSTTSSPLTTDSTTHSATIGLLNRLWGEWSSELDYTWSKNAYEFRYDQYDQVALGTDLASGKISPFVDTIANPIDLASYRVPTSYGGASTLNDIGLRASGTLLNLPAGRSTLTLGIEHRREASSNSTYSQVYPLSPDLSMQQVFFGQAQRTDSIYAEIQVPLIATTQNIPFVHSMDMQVAGRSEHYRVDAGTPFVSIPSSPYDPPQGVRQTISYTSTNPTVGFKYQPVADVAFRASYAKAFLPPTALQLLPNATPTCGFPCTAITDPMNNETYDIDTIAGGNPALKPQTARTWDMGIIWEPVEGALQGIRVDVEHYNIVQPNFITSPSAQQVVANPIYSDRVTRDPATGLITTVNLSPLNALTYKTAGWDISIGYSKQTPYGTFSLHAHATAISFDKRQYTLDGPVLDYVGYPLETGEAKYKGNASLEWSHHGLTLVWTANYVGNYFQGYGSPGSPYASQNGPLTIYTDAQGGFVIPHQTYHDFVASYSFARNQEHAEAFSDHLLSGLAIELGIRNVFNTSPPFDASNAPYYYSSFGDPRLRSYRIGLKKSF